MSETKSNVYSRGALSALKRLGMRVKGAVSVHHLYPRAYCVCKPAPLCAVVLHCPDDSEVQIPDDYADDIIREGAEKVKKGDWCATAYVSTATCQTQYIFTLCELNAEIARGRKK